MKSYHDFEMFEQQFLQLIEEFQAVHSSEHRLREILKTEAARVESAEAARDAAIRGAEEARASAAATSAGTAHAVACLASVQDELAGLKLKFDLATEAARVESAEAARDAAIRGAEEARASAAATSAGTAHAVACLASVQDELAGLKLKFDLAERHRVVLEEKCAEQTLQLETLNRKVDRLRPLEWSLSKLQHQYAELLERIKKANQDFQTESNRLETQLRKVEKSAAGGVELRERARLAAAAHVRERRLLVSELQHTNQELHNARMEVNRLNGIVAELQYKVTKREQEDSSSVKHVVDPDVEALAEVRAALEAEKSGAAQLEKALAVALENNATLATTLQSVDNASVTFQQNIQKTEDDVPNVNCPIDSFLAN